MAPSEQILIDVIKRFANIKLTAMPTFKRCRKCNEYTKVVNDVRVAGPAWFYSAPTIEKKTGSGSDPWKSI